MDSNQMTIDTPTLSKRLCELAGIPWHEQVGEIDKFGLIFHICSCGLQFREYQDLTRHIQHRNPDFRNPVEVLKVMRKRKDFTDFLIERGAGRVNMENDNCLIYVDYILNETGLFLVEAVEFMKGRKG